MTEKRLNSILGLIIRLYTITLCGFLLGLSVVIWLLRNVYLGLMVYQ